MSSSSATKKLSSMFSSGSMTFSIKASVARSGRPTTLSYEPSIRSISIEPAVCMP